VKSVVSNKRLYLFFADYTSLWIKPKGLILDLPSIESGFGGWVRKNKIDSCSPHARSRSFDVELLRILSSPLEIPAEHKADPVRNLQGLISNGADTSGIPFLMGSRVCIRGLSFITVLYASTFSRYEKIGTVLDVRNCPYFSHLTDVEKRVELWYKCLWFLPKKKLW
jgi:hypothetical protein